MVLDNSIRNVTWYQTLDTLVCSRCHMIFEKKMDFNWINIYVILLRSVKRKSKPLSPWWHQDSVYIWDEILYVAELGEEGFGSNVFEPCPISAWASRWTTKWMQHSRSVWPSGWTTDSLQRVCPTLPPLVFLLKSVRLFFSFFFLSFLNFARYPIRFSIPSSA